MQQVSQTRVPQDLRTQPPSCSHAVSAGLPVSDTALDVTVPHSELTRENAEATTPAAPRRKKSSRKIRRSSSHCQQETVDPGTTSLTGDAGTPVTQEPPVTQSKGSGSRHWKDIPEDENERRCQRTLSLRRPVGSFLSAGLSTSGPGSGSNESACHRRPSLRYSGGVVSCALRLVTDVAAMLACEHRLRPRPFLGVLPRNCTSYSRDKACSAILDDANPGSRPASAPAPGRCRTVSFLRFLTFSFCCS